MPFFGKKNLLICSRDAEGRINTTIGQQASIVQGHWRCLF